MRIRSPDQKSNGVTLKESLRAEDALTRFIEMKIKYRQYE